MHKVDKYEYKVRADKIRELISQKSFAEAAAIADDIDWRNVKNGMMLCTVSDLYKMCKRYEDSRNVLLLAYQRNPEGRMILYSLCELSIKLNDLESAVEYFRQYAKVASKDTGKLILQYKLYEAKGESLEERIKVLEQLQEKECKEKWMYELAYLYHLVGQESLCVEECNQLVIYFGEGKYVIKALELKQLHEPLSGEQAELYEQLTAPEEPDISVKDVNVGLYNTIDLQKELADNLKEVLGETEANKPVAEPKTEIFAPVKIKSKEVTQDTIVVSQIGAASASPAKDVVSEVNSESEKADDEISSLQSSESDNANDFATTENITASAATEDIINSEVSTAPENMINSAVTEDIIDSVQPAEETSDAFSQNLGMDSNQNDFGDSADGFNSFGGSADGFNNFGDSTDGFNSFGGSADGFNNFGDSTDGFNNFGDSTDGFNNFSANRDYADNEQISMFSGSSYEYDMSRSYGLDDMLSLDGDGQISMVVPDWQVVEKQITGQICIDEVLLSWERLKKENEQKWTNDVRRRMHDRTQEIMRSFRESHNEDLLSEITAKEETPEYIEVYEVEQTEPSFVGESDDDMADGFNNIPIEVSVPQAANDIVEDTAAGGGMAIELAEPFGEEDLPEGASKEETVSEEVTDKTTLGAAISSADSEDMHEIVIEDDSEEDAESDSEEDTEPDSEEDTESDSEEDTEPDPEEDTKSDSEEDFAAGSDDEPTPEELSFDRSPYVTNSIDIEATTPEPDADDNTTTLPDADSLDYYMKYAENCEAKDKMNIEAVVSEVTAEDGPAAEPEESETEEVTTEDEPAVEPEESENEEVTTEDEPAAEPEESETEEVTAEDEPEEESKSEAEPEDGEEESEIESESEADFESADDEPEAETESEPAPKKEAKIDEENDGLTEDQISRYESFVYSESSREQIIAALKVISMEPGTGNVIIGSRDKDSAIELGKALIYDLSSRESVEGKIAKIKASSLNAKDAEATMSKLADGALIIQDADELRPETLEGIRKVIESDMRMFVVLLVAHRRKHSFIMENTGALTSFVASIDVEELDDTELIEVAHSYANSKDYSIDDMGVLALSKLIGESQTNDHCVTIADIKGFVDDAIVRSSRKSFGNFVSVLVGKRYDENDMIVLGEKDFQNHRN